VKEDLEIIIRFASPPRFGQAYQYTTRNQTDSVVKEKCEKFVERNKHLTWTP
jgi:hypothetical protein